MVIRYEKQNLEKEVLSILSDKEIIEIACGICERETALKLTNIISCKSLNFEDYKKISSIIIKKITNKYGKEKAINLFGSIHILNALPDNEKDEKTIKIAKNFIKNNIEKTK